jgi:putative transposase
MARLPRLVFAGFPHHVTQRGNRRGLTFFEDADYALYCDLLGAAAAKAEVEIWCYCLMPNHVHVIVVPSDEDGLRRTSPTRIAATPDSSTRGSAGPVISGRGGLVPW